MSPGARVPRAARYARRTLLLAVGASLLGAGALTGQSTDAGGERAAAELVPVVIETAFGPIRADIDVGRAPRTAGNFLRYVDDGIFDGGTFYRTVRPDNQPDDSVRIEVIQAGPDASMRDRLRPPIALERTSETGLAHVDGALSMARGGPDTGRASFFVTIDDQPSLDYGGMRNPDGQGFAVFGIVTEGMDVVRRIQAGSVEGQRLVEPVRITSIRREPRRDQDPAPGAPR